MQNLYHSNELVVTRQTNGDVFVIRPNTTPQIMLTITSSEWLQIMSIELITNDKVEQLREIFKGDK